MITRLLIANRGEIATRIAFACRELEIESVAVYSEADRYALHVRAADRALPIGPARATESYLSIPRLLDAARLAGADGVHPGYGFLSEDPSFATACEEAGLAFVGPPSGVLARIGSKIEARRLVEQTGEAVVPGETPADQSDESLVAAVGRVGLPALVKASGGGGGMGMRRVDHPEEIAAAVQAARREALAAFGDPTLHVERLLERPRHVEVQVFGDSKGNVVHLFERECSLQRRRQKVIEESPSPSIAHELRRRITEAAVHAAKAAAYCNAGTVEFLVEGGGNSGSTPFYFLEMNARLQVEHAVTEQTTGVDLVRAQILVASGEPLPWRQKALAQRGHAIEARVYAEDPARGFLPQAGRLLLYREPRMPGVRIDAGVAEGDEVSVHYDSLLAKVIASAETRDQAVARLVSALRAYPVLGICTNLPFLLRVLEQPQFLAGTVDTEFLEREAPELVANAPEEPPAHVAVAFRAHDAAPADDRTSAARSRQAWDPWGHMGDWRS